MKSSNKEGSVKGKQKRTHVINLLIYGHKHVYILEKNDKGS